jgi:diadenosine tetraphosphatase ApaH/serine/threonine PP2A family protein phosphatase
VSEWFPRPRSVRDLVWLGPSADLDVEEVFELLTSPRAREWRDKVGVISPDDGSAKPSTRLLCVEHRGGWVFKTDTGEAGERDVVARRLAKLLQIAARVELWHPSKRWLLLRTEAPAADGGSVERWWPISACPRLATLRAVRDWDRFARLWARALNLGLERSRIEGIGLDLGPSNFGFEPSESSDPSVAGPLWYIDDETYPPLELSDLAEAIVGRIPEWPANDGERWREFGRLIRGLFEPILLRPTDWVQLREALEQVLLAPRWSSARAALVAGVERRVPASAAAVRPAIPAPAPPRRTAVIADVHANVPALEAVIRSAEAEGVDSWLFLGDAVGYGPHARECVARLASLPGLVGVRGNHDHMACFGVEARANSMARASIAHARAQLDERTREWLMALPVEICGEDWLAVHGAPVDPLRFNAYVYAMSYRRNLDHLAVGSRRLCFYGHTHVPMVYRLGSEASATAEVITVDDRLELELGGAAAMLVNPGSVGQPRDGDPRASFAIWDRPAARLQFRRVEYDFSSTCADILAAALPDDLAARLELGR